MDEVQDPERRDPGGIVGLVQLIDEHGPAVEYDLIKLGLRLRQLGTEWLTWRDLLVIVQHSGNETSLFAAMHPDVAPWKLSEHLLAVIADAVIAGNWMQSEDARRKRNRPKPIPRPGVTPEHKKFGGQAEDMAIIRDWLGWNAKPPEKPKRPRDARGRYMKTA